MIFGATGDLSGRYLLSGLATLAAAGQLPPGFHLVGSGRGHRSDENFRDWAAERLSHHAGELPAAARSAVVASAQYRKADVTDRAEVAQAIAGDGPVAVYLALPPAMFRGAISALHDAGLPEGSKVVFEKPFGESLQEAVELNRLLADTLPEDAVFRVDHFLAISTVQNILGTRLANRLLEPVWNSNHIEEVEIVWDETVALEGRATYYDGVGALKDMVQNHLLQILCLVAMEPPIRSGERDLRDRKLDVLRSVRELGEQDLRRRTRRARYTAGRIGSRTVPAYADEAGIDPALGTETFAEVELELESWRWSSTKFRLRTGKALGRDHQEVAVHFRPVPHLPFDNVADPAPNVLRFGLDPEALTLELTGTDPARSFGLTPLTLRADVTPAVLPAYGRVLLDVLNGDPTLSIRGDEAEESWRIVDPIVSAWSNNLVPLEEYAAGSQGPDRKPS